MPCVRPFSRRCAGGRYPQRRPPDRIAQSRNTWGCSSVGRALRSQRRGRRFESGHLHREVFSSPLGSEEPLFFSDVRVVALLLEFGADSMPNTESVTRERRGAPSSRQLQFRRS